LGRKIYNDGPRGAVLVWRHAVAAHEAGKLRDLLVMKQSPCSKHLLLAWTNFRRGDENARSIARCSIVVVHVFLSVLLSVAEGLQSFFDRAERSRSCRVYSQTFLHAILVRQFVKAHADV